MAQPNDESFFRLLSNRDCLPFSVINQGCKVNKVEADTVAANLISSGAFLTDLAHAQLVIVNTCTVTGEADKKARKAVRHALSSSPGATIVVTGCSAALNRTEYERIDERVLVVPREDLLLLTKTSKGEPLRSGKDFRTRVNLKIQDGCDNACTYCIVHVARGRAQSADFEEVIRQAKPYLESQVKEIVLTGIDLGAYSYEGRRLHHLVSALINEADLLCADGRRPARIRASSLEPMTIDDAFIELLASSDGRLCRHLHVPLQSGSSKVLREMARPYDAEYYLNLVEKLYRNVPTLSLSTDIIVGFPGETDRDFEESLSLARECRFSKIHVFPYSRREGTPAAERSDQIDPEVKRNRALRMRRLSDELRAKDYEGRIGQTELALVETSCALTESYHEIPIPEESFEGELVPVILPPLNSSASKGVAI